MAAKYSLVQRHKSRGIKTWYIRISDGSKVYYKSTSTSVKAEAMKVFAKYASATQQDAEEKDSSSISIEEEANEWLEIQHNKFGDYSNTYKLYKGNIRKMLDYLKRKGIVYLCRLNQSATQGIANEMMTSGKRASSIEVSIRCMRIFANWVIDKYDMQIRNPFDKVAKPKVESKIADFWTTEECDAIIANADNEYWRAYFGLQCFAGLRSFEAAKLRVEDVGEDVIVIRQDKTKQDAVIPMSAKLKELMTNAIGDRTSGYIFRGVIGTHHAATRIHIIRAATKAGLADRGRIYQHRLRHSFASNLLRGGVDIKSVQTLGRWASPEVLLKHYAGVIPDALKDAVNKL